MELQCQCQCHTHTYGRQTHTSTHTHTPGQQQTLDSISENNLTTPFKHEITSPSLLPNHLCWGLLRRGGWVSGSRCPRDNRQLAGNSTATLSLSGKICRILSACGNALNEWKRSLQEGSCLLSYCALKLLSSSSSVQFSLCSCSSYCCCCCCVGTRCCCFQGVLRGVSTKQFSFTLRF